MLAKENTITKGNHNKIKVRRWLNDVHSQKREIKNTSKNSETTGGTSCSSDGLNVKVK